MSRDPDVLWTRGVKLAAWMGVVLLLGAMYFAYVATEVVPCGGDGGSPFAAPGSPRGKFCESGGSLLTFLLPPLALVLVGVAADIRRSRTLLVLAFAVAVAVAFAPLVVANSLSRECGGRPSGGSYEELEEFERTHPGCNHY